MLEKLPVDDPEHEAATLAGSTQSDPTPSSPRASHRPLALWLATLVLTGTPGCSFIVTRGPPAPPASDVSSKSAQSPPPPAQSTTEVPPSDASKPAPAPFVVAAAPPPTQLADCTTSVAAPIADTVLSALSLGLVVLAAAGGVFSSSSCTPTPGWQFTICPNQPAVQWFVVGLGVVGIVYAISAVTGYQRTAACRAYEESNGLLPPPSTEPPKSLLKHTQRVEPCPPGEDAPGICLEGASRALEAPDRSALR